MPTFERGAKSSTSQIGVQWFKEETPNTTHQREIKYKIKNFIGQSHNQTQSVRQTWQPKRQKPETVQKSRLAKRIKKLSSEESEEQTEGIN